MIIQLYTRNNTAKMNHYPTYIRTKELAYAKKDVSYTKNDTQKSKIQLEHLLW
jgi:hypothetical protein